MKTKPSSQQGAVMVFSLLILLLISVLGVSMVQQNRTQFMMAENSQRQTANFADAENILRAAEIYIDSQRHAAPLPPVIPADCFDADGQPQACATYDCQTPGNIFQQMLPGDLQGGVALGLALPAGSSVEISKTYCVIGDPSVSLQFQNCSDNPAPASCFFDASATPNPTAPDARSANPCHTELYLITARNIDDANNERVVESEYAVRCDN